MRIVVFGAAGRTGGLVVSKALGHGHEVVAVLHRASLPAEHERLTKVSGDVLDLESIQPTLVGADAAIFALSPRQGGSAHIHEYGIANVIYAMAEHNIRRLSVLSAAGAFDRHNRRLSLTFRLYASTFLRARYDDIEAMERRVIASDFIWTIVRPHHLTNDAATGHYRVALDGSLLPKASRISRADVASLLVKSVETNTYYRRAVTVAY